MSTEFTREDRYIVFKLSDVEEHFTPGEKQQLARLAEVQQVGRSEAGKPPLECVVVEADWPEYEPTWKAIEARMTGAQPAPSVPEDVMRDAERYRYLRARDDETAGIGCWIEAEGRACDRGWLYGVQLDSAIDTCIEMLAAAPEAKP